MSALFGFQLFEITPVGLLCLVGWIVAGLAVGKLLFKDDRELKAMQREANDLAQTLGEWGFSVIPKILTDFALGDLVSLINDFRHAADTFKDPKKVRTALEKLLNNMIKEELKDTATRQAFLDSVVSQAAALGVFPSKPATNGGGSAASGGSSSASPAHVTNVTVHSPTGATATTEAAPAATAKAAA